MRLLAALIFFTRLPLWRWVEVPAGYYKRDPADFGRK